MARPEKYPGDWCHGSSYRWSNPPALQLSSSLAHRGTAARGCLSGVRGCLGSLAQRLVGMCGWGCVGVFKRDSEQTLCLFKREFYHENHLVALRWHRVAQQAGTRIF